MKHLFKSALILCLCWPVLLPEVATANPTSTRQVLAQRRRSLSWRLGVRPARNRIGGFSRSASCPKQAQMTAFVPPPRPEEKIGPKASPIDTTLSSHPTFWVYLKGVPNNSQVQFTLQDAAATRQLYSTRFAVGGQAGILGIRLPKTTSGLKLGEPYLWQMSLKCTDGSNSPIVIGSWIQRITSDQVKPQPDFDPKPLVQELRSASDRDKPALYAGLGIWQDAVTSLVSLRQSNPNDRELRDSWSRLLTGAGMAEWINAPILGIR